MLKKLSACPADNRRAFRVMHGRQARWGFTLFEVSISMLIVAFGVVSVMMILPIGIKAQEMARFQIYVSAKAEEMIEQFSATPHSNPETDTEGLAMWDVPAAHKAQSWDFESRLAAHRFGNIPLPLEIARRLDSSNDEIAEILNNGGYIYYTQPRATSGIEDNTPSAKTPNEAQRLIMGVKGYAQQNGISSFPLKNFPYYAAWPSSPVHFTHYKETATNDNDPFVPAIVSDGLNAANFWAHYDWPGTNPPKPEFSFLPPDLADITRVSPGNQTSFCLLPWETAPQQRVNASVRDDDIQRVWDFPAAASEKIKVPDDQGHLVETRARYGFMQYAYGRRWMDGYSNGDRTPGAYDTKRAGINPMGTKITVRITNPPPGYDVTVDVGGKQKCDPATAFTTHFPAKGHNVVNSSGAIVSSGYDVGGYPSRPGVLRYVVAALWYADRKGILLNGSDDQNLSPYAPLTLPVKDQWKAVQAFRFLAHSTACLTGWYSYNKTAPDTEDLNTGVTIPEAKFEDGVTFTPAFKITHGLIKYYHERAHYLINTFAASYPYDWAVPRSLNRPTMMDFPLMQFDLFSRPLPGKSPNQMATNPLYNNRGSVNYALTWDYIFGRSTKEFPQQWRAVSAQPIRNVGVSASFPTNVINTTMTKPTTVYDPNSQFGNIDHFNLTAPFKAAERCRQLVFWSVDWQSYEDSETAPSAPPDASKYPTVAPRTVGSGTPIPNTISWNDRMNMQGNYYWSYRNPELSMLFHPQYQNNYPVPAVGGRDTTRVPPNPWSDIPTGSEMFVDRTMQKYSWGASPDRSGFDKGNGIKEREVFCGLYGADRNFNQKLDRGPIPRSVRLRAVEIARFNFYDPRVQVMTR